MGCSVVGAEAEGGAGTGAVAAAAAAALVGGEPGAAAAAAAAGDDGGALAGVAAESGADFATDGALVIGGGLCTEGLVTEAALWTGPF